MNHTKRLALTGLALLLARHLALWLAPLLPGMGLRELAPTLALAGVGAGVSGLVLLLAALARRA